MEGKPDPGLVDVLEGEGEREASADRLARSEVLLRAITDSSPDAIFAKDRSGRWTFANAAVLRELGLRREDVIGRNDLEIQPDATIARALMEHDREVMESGQARSYSERVPTPGGVRKFLTAKAPLRDAAGNVVGVVGTAKDVTEIERAAEELRVSRQRLAFALEGSSDGFWDVDVPGRRVFLSRRYREIVGWPSHSGEAGAEEMLRAIDPAHLPAVQADLESLQAGRLEQISWEYRVRGEDGALRWVQSRGKVVERSADGKPSRITGTLSDIQERKSAEEALRASEGRLRIIARSFPNGSVGLFDADDRVIFADGSRLLTVSSDRQALGRTPSDFLPPEVAVRLEEALRRARSGETVRGELRLGSRIVEVIVSAARGEGGPPGMCILVAQDVTARREVEGNLAVASRLAAMGTLISGIAHEINNPLAGAMAGTDWAAKRLRELEAELHRGAAPEPAALQARIAEAVDALEDAMAGARRISAIVRDLVTAGHPSPERSRVRLRDVVSEAVLKMPAPLRDRCMVRVVDDGSPDVLAAPGQLSQAVANLLDNAAASMPAGGTDDIVVQIGPGSGDRACLEVVDRGGGIDPDVLKRVFDPFFTTRPVGQGVGLGLSVAHAIVTAHGGTLTASSTPGKGSTFRIELPPAS